MILTFALLAAAVLALWWPVPPLRGPAPWLVLAALSLASALGFGIVTPLALLPLLALAGVARAMGDLTQRRVPGWLAGLLVVVIAGLMLHRWPGFSNPQLLDRVQLTPDALPYSLYLNYDKTLIGLFLLGWCHPLARRAGEWRVLLAATLPWALLLILVLLILSVSAGYVRFDPKLPSLGLVWAAVNLLSTCTAEEAVFRGFVQAQLQLRWRERRGGPAAALIVAAALFGLAHAGGGWVYVALATVAGLGYGWVYQRTGRIEAAILTHFALNACHFFLFTYPALVTAG